MFARIRAAITRKSYAATAAVLIAAPVAVFYPHPIAPVMGALVRPYFAG